MILRRAALAAASAVLLAVPAFGAPVLAATAAATSAPAPADATATSPKVVIVVGAVETGTSAFRTDADTIYAEAIKYTPNVVKVYSPNATWAAVAAAAQGASVFIYLGHGYGFPSPYKAVLTPSVHDGMGLNEFAGQGDSDKKYYGESLIAGGIRFAKDAIVILNHLCYSAGSSESGMAEPTFPVAKQRVDNFASGFLRAGARAVMADSYTGDVTAMIRSIFTTHQTVDAAWHSQWFAHHHDIVWAPLRNPAYTADMDPDTATTGFHRSIVMSPALTTDQIVAGASAVRAPTNAPELWSVDGPLTISPNFDGDADNVNLVGWFSEKVTWTATITDPAGATLRTLTGSGDMATISWNPVTGGVAPPPGDDGLAIHAVDAAGQVVDASFVVHIDSLPVPGTGVRVFAPTTTMTRSSTLTYHLTFAGPVTGLGAGDFTITGTALGCVIGAPASTDATAWTVTLTSCGTGKVTIQLDPGTVSDGSATGPVGLIAAHWVVVDRTTPKVTTPATSFRTAVSISGSTLQASVAWTGSDSGGSGLLGYDVARSVDGGSFSVIATSLPSPTLLASLTSGHSYRFEVRARDKAGNASTWLAGPTLYPSLVQQTTSAATWTGSWSTVSAASYSGGSTRQSAAAGASVTYAFGGRAVAIVLTTCSTCGQVRVYLDGTLMTTVNTNAASATYRWVGYSHRFSSWGSHAIRLVVVGTAVTPTVSVDAFEVIK